MMESFSKKMVPTLPNVALMDGGGNPLRVVDHFRHVYRSSRLGLAGFFSP